MKNAKYKVVTDILSIILTLTAVITGFVLHNEVWHIHYYHDTRLWGLHETVGLILVVLVSLHCAQHSFWFSKFSKIPVPRKMVTAILLLLGIVVGITGIILMAGSRSETVSHIHFVTGILFTVVAAGHVAKRWKLLKSLV